MSRTILITGASSGIGKAATQFFGHKGYTVFAAFRNINDAASIGASDHIHPIALDVTNEASVQEAYHKVTGLLAGQGLYAIINNAGITYTAPFELVEPERARAVMETNLMAPYRIAQVFLPLLKEHDRMEGAKARVVNIASWAAYMGQPFIGFYNASKAALIALSESMYYDLGLHDIHVVVASPGITRTPLLGKTTRDGTANLRHASTVDQAFYKPYFDHFLTMSESSGGSSMFNTPERVAEKLFAIVEKRAPRFKYNMAMDAVVVDTVLRLIPFAWKAALNRRMFKLGNPKKRRAAEGPRTTMADRVLFQHARP